MRVPRRRRCAATSMNGIESMRACWFMRFRKTTQSADNAARLALCGRHVTLQAAHGDFEARHALRTGNRGWLLFADCPDEGQQLGAQRLRMPGGQMTHRIAAVGLEAEAFGDLPGQKIADQ